MSWSTQSTLSLKSSIRSYRSTVSWSTKLTLEKKDRHSNDRLSWFCASNVQNRHDRICRSSLVESIDCSILYWNGFWNVGPHIRTKMTNFLPPPPTPPPPPWDLIVYTRILLHFLFDKKLCPNTGKHVRVITFPKLFSRALTKTRLRQLYLTPKYRLLVVILPLLKPNFG